MRRFAILALILYGCGSGCARHSPDAIYRNARGLLQKGDLKAAIAEAGAGFRAEPSWRFRLLEAEILLAGGQAREAVRTLDDAPKAPETAEMRARLEMDRGYAKFLLADYTGAESALNRARALAAPLKLPLLDAEIEMRAGVLLVRQNRPAEAEEKLRSALKIATANRDTYLETGALGNLGFLFLSTYRYGEAIYWIEKARESSIRLGSATSTAKALGNLGWCYYRLGDDDKALADLREAERDAERSGNRRDQQTWLGDISAVLLDRADYTGASEVLKRALAISREIGDNDRTALWLGNLSLASIHLDEFDAAAKYDSEALSLDRKLGLPDFTALAHEAEIASARKDFPRAERLYRALLAEPYPDPAPVLEARSGLAEMLGQAGQFDRAAAEFRAAIGKLESGSASLSRDEYKLSYRSSQIRLYQRYVDFLVSRGRNTEALEVAESSRARLLDQELDASGRPAQEVSAAALQRLSRSTGAILLSYWLAPHRSFLWVITPSAIALHELPPEARISALVESYQSFIESLRDPLESEFPAGKELSEILLGPVRPLLSAGARIVVVPDEVLNSVNLETLPDPTDSSKYLIERVEVSIAPSLARLLEPLPEIKARPSLLLIGDPEPAVEEYPRLPFAAREVSLIARDLPADRRVVLDGANASPDAYRDSRPGRFSWIHFAAHAAVNRDSPLDSALILSKDADGYTLPAREVMNVPLHADLVTLSACRSAGSKIYSGEGLVGLSWAFLRAGAKRVVAGLWDVTDMSTAALMADFYDRMAHNASPAAALREAKLKLIHSQGAYRKPFYWGPFQLYVGSE